MAPGGMLFSSPEVALLENNIEVDRLKAVDKKTTEMMLLCLDQGQVSAFTCKKKDDILLKNGECEVLMLNDRQGMSEDDKYRFTLVYEERGVIGSSERRLTLGTDSEGARRDWAFSIMLAIKWAQEGSGGSEGGGRPVS